MGGVGGLVVFPVPPENPPGVAAVVAAGRRPQAHQHPGHAGGDQVEHIVQPGRRPAEVEVFVVLVAHHGVHGVHRLVGHAQGRAADGQEDQRGDHPVGGVLRHRFHGGLGHPRLVQPFGVPAHDHGHGIPGGGEITRLQGLVDLSALHPEGLGGQQLVADQRLHRQGQPGAHQGAAPQQQGGHAGGDAQGQRHQHHAGGQLAPGCLWEDPPQNLLQPGDQCPDGPHRVGGPVGIPQQQIQAEAQQQGQQMGYAPAHNPFSPLYSSRMVSSRVSGFSSARKPPQLGHIQP